MAAAHGGPSRPWTPTDSRRTNVIESRVVTAVVCAAFAPDTDTAILAVRDRVVRAGVALPRVPPHRPHLTLAAARLPPADLPALSDTTCEVASGAPAFVLPLTRVGRFGRAGALWLGPTERADPPEPRSLQRGVDDALSDAGYERAFGHRSTPNGWVPHCTLATRVRPQRLRELQRTIEADYQPIDAFVASLAVILVGGSGDVTLFELR